MKGCRDWQVVQKLETLYSAGRLIFNSDSCFCLHDGSLQKFDPSSQQVISKEYEDLECFTLTSTGIPITFGRDELLRMWVEPPKVWKADCTVVSMEVNSKDNLLATGGSDHSVRVYSLSPLYLTHRFKNHKSPVIDLKWHSEELFIVSIAQDYTCKVWDLVKYACIATFNLENMPKAVYFSMKSLGIITSGHGIKTWSFPTLEEKNAYSSSSDIESTKFTAKNIYLGHADGSVSSISVVSLVLKKSVKLSSFPIQVIEHMTGLDQLLVIDTDFNLFILDSKLRCIKQSIANLYEVYDIKKSRDKLVLATNSNEGKILSLEDLSCVTMKGSQEMILCLDVYEDLIVTGSKDSTIRLWNQENLLATYTGHTEHINSLAFNRNKFFVSCSADKSLKIWSLGVGDISSAKRTVIAHTKDASVVKVSPDGKIIASGSQDKTIKLWTTKLKEKHILEGHRRGVWDLAFCGYERLLASSSGDLTIKLWLVDNGTCVRTLEGHTQSILKIAWTKNNLLSAGNNGDIKIWNIRTGACLNTYENHEDKVWALHYFEKDDASYFVSGSADAKLLVWKDVTEQEEHKIQEEKRAIVQQEQDITNLTKQGKKVEAAMIALKLKRPATLYKIVADMDKTEVTRFVDAVIEEEEGMNMLLKHIRDWNTLKQFSYKAQTLLYELFDRVSFKSFPNMSETLEVLKVYTEKHYSHLEKLYTDSFYIGHLLDEMRVMPTKRPPSELEDSASKKRKTHV